MSAKPISPQQQFVEDRIVSAGRCSPHGHTGGKDCRQTCGRKIAVNSADDGPEFIFNRLEVSGPHQLLYDFIGAASGPGFVDWQPEWHGVYEQIYFGAGRGGAPTREAAENLARKLRDILWRRHEEERVRAELGSHRVPLDLNALIPIPRRILRKGGGKPVAVFRFLSDDWSPWIALLRMCERWPELRFEMKAGYLEMSATRACRLTRMPRDSRMIPRGHNGMGLSSRRSCPNIVDVL